MIYIKALFKAVALFCLSTVLCQGCALFSKKKSIPTGPKVGRVSSQMDQKSNAQQSAQGAGQNLEKSDEKALRDELKPLLQQFMPTHASPQPTLSTAPQDAKGVALQKDMQEHQKQDMAQFKEMLNQSGLSAGQIEACMKLYEDASCKMLDKLLTLPDEKLQSLLNATKKGNELAEDLRKTAEQLDKVVNEAFKSLTREQLDKVVNEPFQSLTAEQLDKIVNKTAQSLKEDGQMELENNGHKAIFNKLFEAFHETREVAKAYIRPEDNQQLKVLDRNCAYAIYKFKQIEALFACSPEAQQACQLHLKDFLSVSKNLLQEEKTIRQIMPHSLVEEIQSIQLEVFKQAADIVGEERGDNRVEKV